MTMNHKMYRGCWLPQCVFPGGNWFAPTLDEAAQYVAMHAEQGRANNYSPHIFESSSSQTLEFVDLNQSHIQAFDVAYGGNWTHAQIVQDIPLAFAQVGNNNWAGFFRSGTQEYFVCDPSVSLIQGNTWSDQQALAEASRVKGFNV